MRATERREHAGKEHRSERRRHADTKTPGSSRGCVRRILLGSTDRFERLAGPVDQGAPYGRRCRAVAAAHEQRCSDFAFELLQAPAQWWLGDVQLARRAGE